MYLKILDFCKVHRNCTLLILVIHIPLFRNLSAAKFIFWVLCNVIPYRFLDNLCLFCNMPLSGEVSYYIPMICFSVEPSLYGYGVTVWDASQWFSKLRTEMFQYAVFMWIHVTHNSIYNYIPCPAIIIIHYPSSSVAQCVVRRAPRSICSNEYGHWFAPRVRHSVRMTYRSRPSAALAAAAREP